MRRLAIVLALFLVAACGSIGVQAQTLKLAYKAGDTYKYGYHAAFKYTIGMQGMSIPVDLDMTAKEAMTVKSVDASGTATIAVAVTDLSVKTTANGVSNTTTTTTSSTAEMKVTSDGRIVSVSGSSLGNYTLPGLPGSQGGLVTAILPDTAVKPGDTWTKNYDSPNPVGSGASHVTTNNKYLRDEKVGGVSTAVVESNIKGTIDLTIDMSAAGGGTSLFPTGGSSGLQGLSMKGTTTSDVTSWVDASGRRVLKSHSTGGVDATMSLNMAAGATTPGLTGPITFKGTQTMDMTPA
ncbi:MAG: hypothetical protein E6J20_03430 [Chloroflexi bacterium]|nr:MAG: hypothetical protein E6J20_03430 [Chloroflexota bacterium]